MQLVKKLILIVPACILSCDKRKYFSITEGVFRCCIVIVNLKTYFTKMSPQKKHAFTQI